MCGVKTTKELLEEIQSRGASAPAPAAPPESVDNDVMLVEPAPCPIKADSPLRNGGSPSPPGSPFVPLEDEREYSECTCGEEPSPRCPAAAAARVRPHHVTALHHAYLPGVNGTRAPLYPHKFAVRAAARADDPSLFASVVPLYNYSDYADDYCAKNMYKVPICESIPMCTFAPPPLSPPPPPSPPPPRPYPLDPDPDAPGKGEGEEMDVDRSPEKCLLEETSPIKYESIKIEPEAVGAPPLEPSERLKAPLLAPDEAPAAPDPPACPPPANQPPAHRTVEKTKEEPELDGRALYDQCRRAIDSIPYDYAQLRTAPEITLPVGVDNEEEAQAMVDNELEAEREDERDELGRPVRPRRFAEWHECARLGGLVALPYVVID
ncbi:vegetative cell wall protein gp1-like [Ostrinia furnacalis]|uniref:vegetative cell wall protein gp1-like n=1 Tax=Ostrinia furnacalis TaxID=93504 RepID=UPI00103974F7|nr:vegetative cell wall protein gp1-like [Ostrinia furnacalis]